VDGSSRQEGNAQRGGWFGAVSEFVFGSLDTRDGTGIVHRGGGGIEENEAMLTNKNIAESKSLRTE
jgi:hypothetical protein